MKPAPPVITMRIQAPLEQPAPAGDLAWRSRLRLR
jgi:hypothetical protein